MPFPYPSYPFPLYPFRWILEIFDLNDFNFKILANWNINFWSNFGKIIMLFFVIWKVGVMHSHTKIVAGKNHTPWIENNNSSTPINKFITARKIKTNNKRDQNKTPKTSAVNIISIKDFFKGLFCFLFVFIFSMFFNNDKSIIFNGIITH